MHESVYQRLRIEEMDGGRAKRGMEGEKETIRRGEEEGQIEDKQEIEK